MTVELLFFSDEPGTKPLTIKAITEPRKMVTARNQYSFSVKIGGTDVSLFDMTPATARMLWLVFNMTEDQRAIALPEIKNIIKNMEEPK